MDFRHDPSRTQRDERPETHPGPGPDRCAHRQILAEDRVPAEPACRRGRPAPPCPVVARRPPRRLPHSRPGRPYPGGVTLGRLHAHGGWCPAPISPRAGLRGLQGQGRRPAGLPPSWIRGGPAAEAEAPQPVHDGHPLAGREVLAVQVLGVLAQGDGRDGDDPGRDSRREPRARMGPIDITNSQETGSRRIALNPSPESVR